MRHRQRRVAFGGAVGSRVGVGGDGWIFLQPNPCTSAAAARGTGAMRGWIGARAVSAFAPAGLAMFATMAAIVRTTACRGCPRSRGRKHEDEGTRTRSPIGRLSASNIALSRGAGSAGDLRGAHRGYRIRAQLSRRMSALSSTSALRASVHLGGRPRAARKSARGAVAVTPTASVSEPSRR